MTPRPYSPLGLLFDIVVAVSVVLALYAIVYTVHATLYPPAAVVTSQASIACAHHTAIGQPYKCARA
jgi:hypothetical protein